MSDHTDGEQLLGFFDGNLEGAAATAVAEHLHACDDCKQRFDEYSEFEAELARTTPLSPDLGGKVRHLTRTTLRAARARRSRWRRWTWSMALAAGLLTGASLWALSADDCTVVVHRQNVPGALRAGDEQRLHLDVTVATPAWLAVFARGANGRITQLLPHADPTLGLLAVPQPLPAGAPVRVPGADLFDFAIDPAAPPTELVLVFAERAFAAGDLAQLAATLDAATPGTLPAGLLDRHPLARLVTLGRP